MPKLYTQEEVDKLIAEKLSSVRTKDLTDDEIISLAKQTNGIYYDCDCVFARAVIAADREKNK